MIITNGAKRLMHKWSTNKMVDDYSISSDWDNRWRTGGSLNEIISEAHLDPNNILKGIELFAKNRQKRLSQLISEIPKS
jgi:transketolase